MPALEMAQETGKLVSWKKKEGEQVKKGEILLEVETDKAVVEIEAASDGVLAGVTAKVDDVVPVGQIIAWLLKAGESVPANAGAPQQSGRKMEAAPAAAAAATAAPEPAAAASVAGAKISPKARRLAREHNVDISKVALDPGSPDHAILWIRIPRVLAALVVGAALAGAGCALQALLRPALGACCGLVRHRRGVVDRQDHGRADDAELDAGAAVLRHPRRRCVEPQRVAHAPCARDRALAQREGDPHRHPGGRRRPLLAQFPAHERQLEQRLDCHARRSQRGAVDGSGKRRRDRVIKNTDTLKLGDIAKSAKV
jgi:hypothetical protein